MREIEEITVFDEPKRVEKKPKVTKGKKSSKSPDMEEEEPAKEEVELSEEKVAALEEDLQRAANAGIAAAAVLTLLDLEGLPKQVSRPMLRSYGFADWQMYSEDLLSLAVSLTKDQMTKVIFPIVACLSGDSE